MKKVLLLIIMLIPINLLAYTSEVIVGGESIGLEVSTKGLTIVGFYKVQDKYINESNLRVGDEIISIEGISVNNIDEMANVIDKYTSNNKVNIAIKRNNKIKNETLYFINEDSIYKTGLYVKNKITGVGTLTYIDPITHIYGALGHQIVMNETNNNIEIKEGNIYVSYIDRIDRSINSKVGSKNAYIDYENSLGSIIKNTPLGSFGIYNEIPNKELTKVASFDEIKIGKAYILTNIEGDIVKEYEIEITGKDERLINTNKAITIKITDEELIRETGGIIQGMSGSPIVQAGKIVGAVTHVVIDEVEKGYAIYIGTMIDEGEKIGVI